MSTLSKHVIVLEFQDNEYGFAFFAAVDEDGELIETHEMRSQHWRDMGEPSQITVTIEPGDKLNEDVQFDKDGNIGGTSG